jgi:hypothetical protein
MITPKEMTERLGLNVIRDLPEKIEVADALRQGFSDADIRDGLKGFSVLLLRVFDTLTKNADTIPVHGKDAVNSRGHTHIYPEIKAPLALLYAIGVCGKVSDDGKCLVADAAEFNAAYKKTRCNKPLENLRLLQEAGLTFSVDLSAKSLNFNKIGGVEVQYPGDLKAVTGLKLIAEATARINGDFFFIFARNDWRALALSKKYEYDLRDTTGFLPEGKRAFFIEMHNHLIANQCKCESKVNMNAYQYTYVSKAKKATVFSIAFSMDHGGVKINSKLINHRPDLLANAPQTIKNAVKTGWDCAKKNNPDACNPNCAPKVLRFALDSEDHVKCWALNFNLPANDEVERVFIKQWLDGELA